MRSKVAFEATFRNIKKHIIVSRIKNIARHASKRRWRAVLYFTNISFLYHYFGVFGKAGVYVVDKLFGAARGASAFIERPSFGES